MTARCQNFAASVAAAPTWRCATRVPTAWADLATRATRPGAARETTPCSRASLCRRSWGGCGRRCQRWAAQRQSDRRHVLWYRAATGPASGHGVAPPHGTETTSSPWCCRSAVLKTMRASGHSPGRWCGVWKGMAWKCLRSTTSMIMMSAHAAGSLHTTRASAVPAGLSLHWGRWRSRSACAPRGPMCRRCRARCWCGAPSRTTHVLAGMLTQLTRTSWR
mmetsp:Transcript_14368/g.45232  ORF Transcript_14368/g.45232 Transcript_14368/m.45232 type:complete len:220 (+) Transcript_14368:1199-1858(+)